MHKEATVMPKVDTTITTAPSSIFNDGQPRMRVGDLITDNQDTQDTDLNYATEQDNPMGYAPEETLEQPVMDAVAEAVQDAIEQPEQPVFEQPAALEEIVEEDTEDTEGTEGTEDTTDQVPAQPVLTSSKPTMDHQYTPEEETVLNFRRFEPTTRQETRRADMVGTAVTKFIAPVANISDTPVAPAVSSQVPSEYQVQNADKIEAAKLEQACKLEEARLNSKGPKTIQDGVTVIEPLVTKNVSNKGIKLQVNASDANLTRKPVAKDTLKQEKPKYTKEQALNFTRDTAGYQDNKPAVVSNNKHGFKPDQPIMPVYTYTKHIKRGTIGSHVTVFQVSQPVTERLDKAQETPIDFIEPSTSTTIEKTITQVVKTYEHIPTLEELTTKANTVFNSSPQTLLEDYDLSFCNTLQVKAGTDNIFN